MSSNDIGLRNLLAPLEQLIVSGGDNRLHIHPDTGCNQYGCTPLPMSALCFSSSTATSISERAYERAGRARDLLVQSSTALGLEEALDSRLEAMRHELKHELGLSNTAAEIVFSPSGTDAQLLALLLARNLLGTPLTTVVVAADQTGSGTVHTARGQHFGNVTANGCQIRKGDPIDGVAESISSVALTLRDENGDLKSLSEYDSLVIDVVRKAVGSGSKVLLQMMDSSKFGWRAPSDACIAQIVERWPGVVQIVVDACQMRLGRHRIRSYLDRGFIVLISGSKFFTGPPFSGALLVPGAFLTAITRNGWMPGGLLEYGARSDWPKRWQFLRSSFPARPNLGQWLRWEAALDEIRHYFSVPDAFRRVVIEQLGVAVEETLSSSRSLRLLSRWPSQTQLSLDDEEHALRTMFPFAIERNGRELSLEDCKKVYERLKAAECLIGQPVGWNSRTGSVAVLRISISARDVSDAWAFHQVAPEDKVVKSAMDRVSHIVAAIQSTISGDDL